MSRPLFIRVLLVAVAVMAGCAHRPLPSPRVPGDWRSSEGVGDAHWGMTPDELKATLQGSERIDPTTYQVREMLDGKPSLVTYAFPYGHLATVTLERETDTTTPADFDEAFASLSKQYGDPLPPPGASSRQDDETAAAVIVAIALILGLVLCAVATKGAGAKGWGGGAHAAGAVGHMAAPAGVVHPASGAWWVGVDALRLAADGAEVTAIAASQPGPGAEGGGWMAEWRTADTEVILVGKDLGYIGGRVIQSYRSIQLAPPSQGQEATGAP